MSAKISLSLSILNLTLMTVFVVLFCAGKLELKTKKVTVIDQNGVERIHLDPASSDVRVLGKTFKRRSPASGMILFNKDGDENGGFVVLDDGTASMRSQLDPDDTLKIQIVDKEEKEIKSFTF